MDEHVYECDVLVAGGGPAGIGAALSAARNGARVILCQDRSVLGGNASSEVRMHIVGSDVQGKRGVPLATEARESGLVEEIRLETSVRNPQRSPSMFDLILYDLCRAEPNITLLLDTTVTGVKVENDLVVAAYADRQSTEDRFRIDAQVFIDCTGDGRLGKEAGVPYSHGREAKEEYGESLAQEEADNKTLGSTLLFQAKELDHPVPFVAPSWVRHFTEDDLKLRPHAAPGVNRGLEYGYWWVEWGGTLDTIKDNAHIRDELLAIMLGVWDHIKNGGDHGADNWVLEWFGFLPGKRESRRFTGHTVLTENDLMNARPYRDAIAYGGWPIDLHPPHGIDAIDEKPARQIQLPHLYDIPLSACVARKPRNVMFAGRNISATHVAFGSTRVMATCIAMGQGVGTAAAWATKHQITPADLLDRDDLLHEVQQRLLRDDAFLIGITNEDPFDVARQATVRASSEQSNGPATNILSGQTRAVHGDKGVDPDRTTESTHRWMSDPQDGLPAWIQLEWDHPVTPEEIHLVFDTGLHRPLTLTHTNALKARMEWGVPQPETIDSYVIDGWVDGHWQRLLDVTGNYQRRRVHTVNDAPPVTRLRITCTATHGIDHARLFEVRVYEPN